MGMLAKLNMNEHREVSELDWDGGGKGQGLNFSNSERELACLFLLGAPGQQGLVNTHFSPSTIVVVAIVHR
uniref:Uncharacterized protein n=1 Tax=Loa loa TaxID=7209 RepID=A0A1I7VR78_LOALO